MRNIVIAAALAVILLILLLMPKLQKYKGYILAAYALVSMLLVAVPTFGNSAGLLPFYHAKEQTFYQKEFADEGTYPDALFGLAFENKTIYIKDDLDEYLDEYYQEGDTLIDGKYWLYGYYHQKNLEEFLEANEATVIADDIFNDKYIDESTKGDFKFAGYGNDMFRFMFQTCEYEEEWGNYFYHYWYYSDHLDGMEIYINPENINTSDELVILWDDKENETLFIMTRDYYDREVA